ncbi:aldo/keto reductase [Mucilaginibacter sp. 22184]|uniref:aldo/keto reductase n=1 Tax=Mucilaginibacter sp. 22184 TaxID=3453887 RepID=UPI003F83CB5A
MEYRTLGNSGLKVPVLSLGTATFGGGNEFFKAWGSTQVEEASRMVRLCLEAGVNLFDTANVYSDGLSEEILGKALQGLRNEALISSKATFPIGKGPNNFGSSRQHLITACEDSLRRLGTDHIDIYHMHGFDATTPIEETLKALDSLVNSGKVRYIACSNFSGWHLMESLSVSERHGWSRYISQQVYYNLLDREYEWELMPLGIQHKVGSMIWSPLAGGKLSGKYRRNQPLPQDARVAQGGDSPTDEAALERLYRIVDILDELSVETGKSLSQIALNWLLQRPTVSNIVIGARNEQQLTENLGALGWRLSLEQVKRLDAANDVKPIYPYAHQRMFGMLNAAPDLYSTY